MKLTRRKLAVILTAGPALAQSSQTPDDLLKAARDRNKANADQLAAERVPMATEPAFQFKA